MEYKPRAFYDIYDLETGKLIVKHKGAKEIKEELGYPDYYVSTYKNKPYMNKFVSVDSGQPMPQGLKINSEPKTVNIPLNFEKDWKAINDIFKNVIWVHEWESGVKVLRRCKSCQR